MVQVRRAQRCSPLGDSASSKCGAVDENHRAAKAAIPPGSHLTGVEAAGGSLHEGRDGAVLRRPSAVRKDVVRQEQDRGRELAGSNQPRSSGSALPDRQIRLGINHPSDDPSQHRVFEVRATFDAVRGGWVAWLGEQNLNEQLGRWAPLAPEADQSQPFPTAAACLGAAVATIVATVDRAAGRVDVGQR